MKILQLILVTASLFGVGACTAISQIVTYNGGSTHTGYCDSPPLCELRGLKWKYDTGADLVTSPQLAYGSICFPPLLHNGMVYFTSHDSCL